MHKPPKDRLLDFKRLQANKRRQALMASGNGPAEAQEPPAEEAQESPDQEAQEQAQDRLDLAKKTEMKKARGAAALVP